jgi:hypothetical protein
MQITHASSYSEFLGANEFDDRPFIVMPYMSNGNARDYARGHPDCDRLQIVGPSYFVHLYIISNGERAVASDLARSCVPSFA